MKFVNLNSKIFTFGYILGLSVANLLWFITVMPDMKYMVYTIFLNFSILIYALLVRSRK